MFALQTAVGSAAAAPTHTLKATQFMPPLEQLIRTKDEGSNGTIRNRRSRVQGVQADARTVTVELTMAALKELLKVLGPVATNVITPSDMNFDNLAPGIPLTIWQLHPTGDRVAQDVQVGSIQISVNSRANVTAQISFMVTSSQKLVAAVTAPVTPDDQLQFKHWWLKINDVLYKPETGGVNIQIPMQVVDGANGTNAALADYPVGWERTDSPTITTTFSLPVLVTALRDAYEQNTLVKVESGFTLPGATPKTLKFTVDTAEVNSVNVPSGMERVVVPYEAVGVSEDTLAEYEIALPA
ncbi:hypothetical protein [Deinococcus multiflagellatus]